MRFLNDRTIAVVCVLLMLLVTASAVLVIRSAFAGSADTDQTGEATTRAGDAVPEEAENGKLKETEVRHEPEAEISPEPPSTSVEPLDLSQSLTPVAVQELNTERVSGREIRLTWPDTDDELVSAYLVLRKTISDGGASDWETVALLASDGTVSGEANTYTDILDSDRAQQFAYRIDVEPADSAGYTGQAGRTVLASNILICLDPGHYAGASPLSGENLYGYTEGDFTLQIGLKLKQILKEEYGIDSRMTRETGTIQLSGYTNSELDSHHISLRGQYAEGCDFFLSLHTNANEDYANGYPTCNQPVAANKTLVIVNQPATRSGMALRLAGAVGQRLSEASYRQGLSTSPGFSTAADAADVIEWSKSFNDALNTPGAVCQRMGETGDYYGVLRGAADVGVPGAIIEHGLHTIAEVRQAAMEGDLADLWAAADASGIAYGFAFLAVTDLADL